MKKELEEKSQMGNMDMNNAVHGGRLPHWIGSVVECTW